MTLAKLKTMVGTIRGGWKLESVERRSRPDFNTIGTLATFVRVDPVQCECGTPMSTSPTCPKCRTRHLCWSAINTEIHNWVQPSEMENWG